MTPQEILIFKEKNSRWLEGKAVIGFQFSYNSAVEATLPTGETKIGWIVSAWLEGGEPMYTIEAEDGSGDHHCKESMLHSVEA